MGTRLFRPGFVSLRDGLCGVALQSLTQSLSQRERARSTLPLWGRDRERAGLRAIPRQPCQDEKFAFPDSYRTSLARTRNFVPVWFNFFLSPLGHSSQFSRSG